MDKKRKGRRIGLQAKINIILFVSILLISLGLVKITYMVYCRKVDSLCFEKAQLVTSAYAVPYGYVQYLHEVVRSEAFQEVRSRAVAANDEEILIDWMRQQPPVDYLLPYYEEDEPYLDEDGEEMYTLYGMYKVLVTELKKNKDIFDVKSLYLQYYEDGLTYTLADPDESVLIMGEAEEPIADFSQYAGNMSIPPTVYQYQDQWLCTVCEPVTDYDEEDSPVLTGMICADLDMNRVIKERHWFLVNSAVFITVLTLAAMFVSMQLIRKLAAKPLKLLAEGTTGFAKGEEGFSREDVIRLPIWSNDEIGDLYHEIQSMQERIVESTDRLTSITAERERVSTELRMATQIQAAMLPGCFPPFPDRKEFDLYATMKPAKEVGGDFYDFFLIDQDHLCLLVADVSGKGVPAALFMMASKILINYRAQMGGTPSDILTAVNAQISKDNETMMFVTVWMGILDVNTGLLTCANAGHEFPLIRSKDGIFRVFKDTHGIILGVRTKARYEDYVLTMEPGDVIFVYTDGVPEATNGADEMYGMQRLEEALNRAAGQSPEGILDVVRSDVDEFADGAKQFDDITMLCLEYKGPEKKG